jgi:hypothetical protein
MEGSRPNVFVININPGKWEECLKDHRFGIRVDARHPKFSKGDIFLVRRTGKDYGVMGIWLFKEERFVAKQDGVSRDGSDHSWQQWFDPIVDFKTHVSEEFIGETKFSSKIQMAAARLVGSIVLIYGPEVTRYLEMILKEKVEECSAMVVYQGQRKRIADILLEVLGYYRNLGYYREAKPERSSPRTRKGAIEAEIINFRGMVYAPLNKTGVVLLFSKVMDDLGVIYVSSPPGGFDMVGRVGTERGIEFKHFEFEYKSSHFRAHSYNSSLVDYLVCWEHDWKDCPRDLEVWELRELIKNLPAEFPIGLESDSYSLPSPHLLIQ